MSARAHALGGAADVLGHNPLRTREDFQRAVREIVHPLLPAYREGGARVVLGMTAATYDAAAEGLEAFARPLWGLAPLAAGGGEFGHWDLIRRGLVNGTDPAHPEYWGETMVPEAGSDQRMVERAAIGFTLALAPDEIYTPLTAEQRHNVIDWLAVANRATLRDNNWQLFRVLVNLGFARVGGPVDAPADAQSLDTVEANYLGEGWYQDGARLRTTDFYVPFAFHYYGLLYAALAGDADPARGARLRERARRFTQDWEARFDSAGRVIAYGRSMTYRFAGASLWGALAFAGEEALPWGQLRGLWARHLRWWARQPIFDAAGIMTIGWGYPNLLMAESYNAPGSPYWALKAFLPLALPADHPFWAAEEENAAQRPRRSVQTPANAVVNRTGTQAQMLTTGGHGQWFPRHGAAKYGKFAYSSAFPFSLEPDDGRMLDRAESTLALIDSSGERRVRAGNLAHGLEGDVLWARWQPFPDVTVLSVYTGEGDGHVRLHVIDTARKLTAVEGGFAIEYTADPARETGYREEVDGSLAVVHNAEAASAIADPTGARTGVVRILQPNTGLQWPRSVAPMLESVLPPGRHVLAATVRATERPDESFQQLPQLPERLLAAARLIGDGDIVLPD